MSCKSEEPEELNEDEDEKEKFKALDETLSIEPDTEPMDYEDLTDDQMEE